MMTPQAMNELRVKCYLWTGSFTYFADWLAEKRFGMANKYRLIDYSKSEWRPAAWIAFWPLCIVSRIANLATGKKVYE